MCLFWLSGGGAESDMEALSRVPPYARMCVNRKQAVSPISYYSVQDFSSSEQDCTMAL